MRQQTLLKFGGLLTGAMALLLAIEPLHAAPHKAPHPVPITSCGFLITRPGVYEAANDLDATHPNQNCIEIAAPNVILNLKGFHVYGNKNDPTGIGILIRKGADHALVEGGDERTTPPPKLVGGGPTAGGQAEVSRWAIGIEDDANDARIALFSAVGGIYLYPGHSAGNAIGGVLLKGVNGAFVGALNARFNGKYGVMLDHSTRVTMANISADQNETGAELNSSNDNSFGPGGAESNKKYGIWLRSSSRNKIHDSNGNQDNHDTGILLSCASGSGCPGNDGSNDNRITNAGAPRNDLAGIVIMEGSHRNVVTVTHNEDNGKPKSDMVDLNTDCDSNVWYNNVGSGNQSCTEK